VVLLLELWFEYKRERAPAIRATPIKITKKVRSIPRNLFFLFTEGFWLGLSSSYLMLFFTVFLFIDMRSGTMFLIVRLFDGIIS